MKPWLRKKIRNKLHNYRVLLNTPDIGKPVAYTGHAKVAVIGAGIAGISAASNLAERGFSVTLFEKNPFLGGKVGSWEFTSGTETLRTEHGFHAFFRQYYNLRNYMQKTGAFSHLIPIDDYVILFGKNQKQGFSGLEPTPGLNVLDLRKQGVFNYLTLISPFSMPFLNLLNFDSAKTFRRFDKESFSSFARRTLMPKKMRLVFNSFARAFFSEPEKMSMAELMKGFHFYFLSNEDGLIYDVLQEDFAYSFLQPAREFLEKHNVEIRLNSPVKSIEKTGTQFHIADMLFDEVVVCTDVPGTQQIVAGSPSLNEFALFSGQVKQLEISDRYAVLRIWTDRFEKENWPFFVFTDRLKCLDSITLYHRMEKESKAWSEQNSGGIFELHCYALPGDLRKDEEIQHQLLHEFYHYFPEMEGCEIRHRYFQHRNDFAAFHTGQHKNRPEIQTEIEGLWLAGDWVKMDNPSMLMEAAYTSGALAANFILTKYGLRENQLESVPLKGILS